VFVLESAASTCKLEEGPLHCFYTPYDLCHVEVPTTVRAG